MPMGFKRGDVHLVNFNPSKGQKLEKFGLRLFCNAMI